MNGSYLFVSGWAGYPQLFPGLSDRGEFLLPFVSHDERAVFDRLDQSPASTLIGWSTGAHMILKRWPRVVERFDRIVLLAPFLAFTDYTAEKIVRLMARGLRRDPDKVVNQFLVSCGVRGRMEVPVRDVDGLLAGLEYLRTSRAAPVHRGAEKTTIIHGEYDRIVPPVASEDIWETLPGAAYTAVSCGHWIPEQEYAAYTV